MAGLAKIKEGAKNHHLGLKKYATKRLARINQQLKNARSEAFRFWLLRYRRKLNRILATS